MIKNCSAGLMKALKSSLKRSKQRSTKHNQTVSSMKTAYFITYDIILFILCT